MKIMLTKTQLSILFFSITLSFIIGCAEDFPTPIPRTPWVPNPPLYLFADTAIVTGNGVFLYGSVTPKTLKTKIKVKEVGFSCSNYDSHETLVKIVQRDFEFYFNRADTTVEFGVIITPVKVQTAWNNNMCLYSLFITTIDGTTYHSRDKIFNF